MEQFNIEWNGLKMKKKRRTGKGGTGKCDNLEVERKRNGNYKIFEQ